jgi:hypothetical protein
VVERLVNIYDLLRKLILASAKTGTLDKKDAFEGVNLVNRLEASNAFGTMSAITNGEFDV